MFISNVKFYVKSTISSTQGDGTTFRISEDFETGTHIESGTSVLSIVLKTVTQIERMTITCTGGVATIVQRGLTQADEKVEDTELQKQWTDGTIGYVTAFASDLLDIDKTGETTTISNDIEFTGDETFTGEVDFQSQVNIPTFADTTARDTTYTSPSNGDICFVTGEGQQVYSGGAWVTLDEGTPTPNASTTVSGKLEVGTSSESIAGTDTGGTGALLSVLPSDIAKNTQSGTFLYGEDAEASDTYVISLTPALTTYTTGQTISFKPNTSNTGACTINIDGLGATSIKLIDGTDPLDGDLVGGKIYTLKYDGTNFVVEKPILRFGGDGSDGDFTMSTGTTTLSLNSEGYIEKNYSSMNITGGTLNFDTIPTNGGIAVIRCKGDFTMSAGTVTMTGGGGSSGARGINFFEELKTNAGINDGSGVGVGGAGNIFIVSNGTSLVRGQCGAGGASGGGGAGGRGGGILIIEVGGVFNFTGGTISSNGNNGVSPASGGGGGGGGGGTICIIYNGLTSNTGTISVNGGDGGDSGGNTGVTAQNASGGGGGGYSAGGDGEDAGLDSPYGTGGAAGASGGASGGGGGGAGALLITQNYYFS